MISHKHKFIFTLLPKTGTTSIVNLFKNSPLLCEGIIVGSGHERHYDKLSGSEINYFKISSCRNPFAKVVSLWKFWNWRFERANLPTTSFSYFISNYSKMQKKICLRFNKHDKIHFYNCVDGVALSTGNQLSHTDIDFWVKTENLQQDFNTVCDKIGIPKRELPFLNKTNHKKYTEYYDDETKQIVAEKYAKDIKYFGYEFGQ